MLLLPSLAVVAGCTSTGVPPVAPPEGPTTPIAPHAVEGNIARFTDGDVTLTLEFLDDDLVHAEYAAGDAAERDAIPVSPMIAKVDYAGPPRLSQRDDGSFETAELLVSVDANLCLTATDLTRQPPLLLSTICPDLAGDPYRGVSFRPDGFTHVYGLGQKFVEPGDPNGDWVGRQRFPGEFGNIMEPFNNGAAGNTQIPLLYFVGGGTDCYAVFFDDTHQQVFDFTGDFWRASMTAETVRFYLMAGPDLRDLRSDYLELTGRPPVPPKKMFGLWVSEFGFESWAEVWDKLSTLRVEEFPVDGFVLDLQWYGGIFQGSDDTRMGSLTWDQAAFSGPPRAIARLAREQGIGLLTVEQPYVGRNLPEHQDLESRGYLVRQCETCPPVYLTDNPWWGKGGMIDFTNPDAGSYWHDLKRQPLIDAGILGHWTDLGEPEAYDPEGWYWGVADAEGIRHEHSEVHNLYNFLWSRSIFDGYQRNEIAQRPFILSRSGAPGSQRLGVALWSGDLSGLLTTLATHLNAQMHVSMSGIDYYGSDVGGFWRQDVDQDATYTQWLADSALIDVPLRPHTFNLDNANETAPDRIGDLASNLANVRLRYRLSPYLYSLAHQAWRTGEAVFPPLVYAFMNDPEVRGLGSQKMIGPYLMAAMVAEDDATDLPVYLPAGMWFDFHSGEVFQSKGEWIGPVPLSSDGVLRLPLFARAGAIVPMMYVDGKTMNIEGRRTDGSVRDELILRVYAGADPTTFTLFEDDGTTTAYQNGEVRMTEVSQAPLGEAIRVRIASSTGDFEGAESLRQNVIELFAGREDGVQTVTLNGESLARLNDEADFAAAESGWIVAADGSVRVKTGVVDVGEVKQVEFGFALR
jgi:alpha-glucosidase